MLRLKSFYILCTCVILALLLVGCEKESAQIDTGLPNPASVYCTGLGFKEETRENDAGQYGVCIFDDGSECDSWDFLAGRCGQEHSFCAQQGFTLKTGEGNIGVCQFDDGSSCDELAYFQDDCQPGENMP